MSFHKSGSDLEFCAHCDRTLTTHEDVLCGPCAKHALDNWHEPTDAELARRDAMIERGWRHLAAVLAGSTLVAALITGLGAHLASETSAQDTRTVTRTINDRPYTWTLPEAGCALIRGWEDGSAQAWCPSGLLTYDPDGSANREAGVWYAADYSG